MARGAQDDRAGSTALAGVADKAATMQAAAALPNHAVLDMADSQKTSAGKGL
jgi:hypothetical protein